MKTIHTVVGARPQFIKAAAVSRVFRSEQYRGQMLEKVIHTGQHYDANMSDVFFKELDMQTPEWSLNCGTGSHSEMTAKMLVSLENLFLKDRPDAVLLYGDTNSTLAGALAAAKLDIPILHVEAGLRSFNKKMPEEINRIVTDALAVRLYCPTQTAVDNLMNEGRSQQLALTGDVMYDICMRLSEKSDSSSIICRKLGVSPRKFALVTLHRAENTDDDSRLRSLIGHLEELSKNVTVVFPVHPRTIQRIRLLGLESALQQMIVQEPLGYFDLLQLAKNARAVITDSGGLQKEAYFLRTPCITLRGETEWIETLDGGWNVLFDPAKANLLSTFESLVTPNKWTPHYGDGNACEVIVSDISRTLGSD